MIEHSIKILVAIVSLFLFYKLLTLTPLKKERLLAVPKKIPLLFTGLIANIADTLGIGSFAIIVALNNRWKFVNDKKIPGTLNGQAVLPAMLQSLLFLHVIELDITLLIGYVLSACLGGIVSGYLVARLDQQSIRIAMCFGFFGIGSLILANQLGLLPVGGEEVSLSPGKFVVGLPALFLAGMLPAIGVGLYVPIQVILFFLGLSPLVAFPIMTTAGVFAQSVALYPFIRNKEVPIQETLYLTFAGVVGVLLAVPFVTWVDPSHLRWLLLFIVFYNVIATWRSYQQDKEADANLDRFAPHP